MNCDKVRKLLSLYIDCQLDGRRRQLVDSHLESCEECRKELFDLKASLASLKSVPSDDPGPEFNAAVMRRLREPRDPELASRFTPVWGRGLKLAFGLALACILIIVAIPVYVANMKSLVSRQEIYVLNTGSLIPGSRASVRVVVAGNGADRPIEGAYVTLALAGNGLRSTKLLSGKTDAAGTLSGSFMVPAGLKGQYKLIATSSSRAGTDSIGIPIELKRQVKVMVTTDKPIYQPGQTIHIRALALLRPSLKPAAGDNARFTIEDPKGNKICDQTQPISEWGVASIDFQLGDEIGLGTYNIKTTVNGTPTTKTITIKRYVLPKFKVSLTTDKTYYLPGQVIRGTVSAGYFFGKPASGARVTVDLSALVVGFDRFARIKGRTNGQGIFQFQAKAPDFMVGQPTQQGGALMSVSASVTDTAEHAEQITETIPVARTPVRIALVPESGRFVPGLENVVYVVTSYPDGRPAPAQTTLKFNGHEQAASSDALGVSVFAITPTNDPVQIKVGARTAGGPRTSQSFDFAGLPEELRYTREYLRGNDETHVVGADELDTILVRADKAVYDVGDTASIGVVCTKKSGSVYLDAVLDGQTVLTTTVKLANGRALVPLDMSNDMAGTLAITAYTMSPVGVPVRDTVNVLVRQANQLNVSVRPDKQSYRPGEKARLDLTVSDAQGRGVPAAVGVNIVDESVFSVEEQAPGLAALYFALQEEILKPRYQVKDLFDEDEYQLYRDAYRNPEGTARTFQQMILRRDPQTGGVMPGWSDDHTGLASAGLDEAAQRAAKVLFAYGSNAVETSTSAVTQSWKDREIEDTQRRFESDGNVIKWFCLAVMTLVLLIAWFKKQRGALIWSLIGLAALATMHVSLLVSEGPSDVVVPMAVLTMALSGIVAFALLAAGSAPNPASAAFSIIAVISLLLLLAAILFPVFCRARECARRSTVQAMFRPLATAAGALRPGGEPTGVSTLADSDVAINASAAQPTRVRQFFPETLYSDPAVITDESGRGSVELEVADSITSWRISAMASSKAGQVGSVNVPLKVFQEFFVDLDLPVGVTQGDEISVPVAVYNYLPSARTITLALRSDTWFEPMGAVSKETKLGPNGVGVVYFPIRVKALGRHALTVAAQSGAVSDAVKREITVYPNGKEMTAVANGILSGNATETVSVPNYAIPGASKLLVKLYPGAFSQVVDGLDALLHAPYGCFEQTSSITYPNVLILKYLEAQNKDVPKIRMKAEQFISLGYQRLLTFEVSGGGFDWYGHPPANTILTAYGIMELTDMADVATVDKGLITRAKNLLASRQKDDGRWTPDVETHTWGEVSSDLTVTAYVTWALCEGGFADSPMVQSARGYLEANADQARDSYTLALVANALVASHADAGQALSRLASAAIVGKDRASWAAGSSTLTYGSGGVAAIETTALAAYAFIKSGTHAQLATQALNELVASKDRFGSWETTQATILALKALLAGAEGIRGGPSDVTLSVNGRLAQPIHLSGSDTDVAVTVDVTSLMRSGRNVVGLSVNGEARPAYQVVLSYYVPWSRVSKPSSGRMSVDVNYGSLRVGKNGVVDVTATVRANGASVRMAIVDLGLPPGFAPDEAGFDALKQKRAIDRYEITPRQVILYVRDIAPGRPLTLHYTLRALYPVRAVAPSSSAYDYYNPEAVRGTAKPVVIQVI